MHQPFLNSASEQLNFMTTEELREIFSDDDKLETIVINEILKSLENERDAIISENRSLAESNLEMEPRLIEARSRVNELTAEGKESSKKVQTLLEEIKSKSSSVNPESMLDILKATAAESEEKSDQIAENFLDRGLTIDEFLDQFKSCRIEMHLRKLKADKMQELLRNAGRSGPPSSGPMAYPGNSSFYASYPSSTPYPMMPMPPNYRPQF